MSFVHLRVHSEYSLEDSTLRISDLIDFANREGMFALGLCDKNNLYAAIKFYQAARKAGIKPLLGCQITLYDSEHDNALSELFLYAMNRRGFTQLCELVSAAYLEDRLPQTPAIKRGRLTLENCSDLLCLSGGYEGEIGKALRARDLERAAAALQHWRSIFPERFYLEVSRLGRDDETFVLQQTAQLAQRYTLPCVATNPACFRQRSDFDAHEVRVCISSGQVLEDERRQHLYSDQQYLRGSNEMEELFRDAPQLLENTEIFAKRCNVELDLGHHFLPDFPIPAGQSTEDYLSTCAYEGLEARLRVLFPDEAERAAKRPLYEERLRYELSVINQMGFPGYYLIVADFIRWAKEHDVPVGPGRGSGAGSLVAYAIRITELDPIAYDLLFERFLNPERVSMPDFDVDFCMEKRDQVIAYVAERYGHDRVAQIATHGTMAAKAVVRDVGRVMGLPYGFVDGIAKLIPFVLGITLSDALGRNRELYPPDSEERQKKDSMMSPELMQRYHDEENVRRLIDRALQLEGLVRNVGKHAGGVVIAPSRLTDFSALYSEDLGWSNVVTQFDKDDIEQAGLVKFDFLGLKTLTIIDWAVKNINADGRADKLAIDAIPLDDAATYELLKSAATTAVFQLESRGMKELIRKLQPDCLEDIIALVALFRPGPLKSGMVDSFIRRKHGEEEISYPHPLLEPILRSTYGVIVYQEQVMQIAQVMANYSLGRADLLRRAMGKKKAEEMKKQRSFFVEHAEGEQHIDRELAERIFNLMEKFAEYGFNKSHSAAYALVAYQTAWLKTHYPAQFMAAVLSADMDNVSKIVSFIEECRQMGLKVLPPDVNQSERHFTVNADNAIVYGLGAVKGVGSAVQSMVEERREHGSFQSMLDFCQRVNLKNINRATLEKLIGAGAFDSLEPNRGGLFAALPDIMRLAEQHQRDVQNQQSNLFAVFDAQAQQSAQLPVSLGAAWDLHEQLRQEKEMLGLFLSDHPINRVEADLKAMCQNAKLVNVQEAQEDWELPHSYRDDKSHVVYLGGLVVDLREISLKTDKKMMVVTLDDRSARQEICVFQDTLDLYRDLLQLDRVLVIETVFSYQIKREEWRATAHRIYSFEEARLQLARSLELRVDEAQGRLLAQQPQLLALEAGRVPLSLKLCVQHAGQHLSGVFRLPSVTLNSAELERLSSVLGANALHFSY